MIKDTWLGVLGVLAVVVAGCGGAGNAEPVKCTQIGCSSGLQLSTPLALTSDQIQTSALTICRNGGACAESDLRAVTLPPLNRNVELTFSAASVGGELWHMMSGFVLAVDYAGRPEELHDGDVYDLTLRAPDGTTLLALHQTVIYKSSRPNGPQCEPLCVQADVSLPTQ